MPIINRRPKKRSLEPTHTFLGPKNVEEVRVHRQRKKAGTARKAAKTGKSTQRRRRRASRSSSYYNTETHKRTTGPNKNHAQASSSVRKYGWRASESVSSTVTTQLTVPVTVTTICPFRRILKPTRRRIQGTTEHPATSQATHIQRRTTSKHSLLYSSVLELLCNPLRHGSVKTNTTVTITLECSASTRASRARTKIEQTKQQSHDQQLPGLYSCSTTDGDGDGEGTHTSVNLLPFRSSTLPRGTVY